MINRNIFIAKSFLLPWIRVHFILFCFSLPIIELALLYTDKILLIF